MIQGKTVPETNFDKVVALGDTAWSLLANRPINQIDFDAVADMALVDRGLAAALAGSVQNLILAKMTELDNRSVFETYEDIQDAIEVPVSEKITEGLLHRFEVYSPYRDQISQLNKSARSNPELALRLLAGLEAVIRRILVIAGDPALGVRGCARVTGVVGVFLATARVWMKDDSKDLAATMKALDQRMAQAEEWGISLRLFDFRCSYDGFDDRARDEKRCDEVTSSRHGVGND